MTILTCPVRKADAADEVELMELCRALHAENGMFTMSEDKVRRMLHRAFDKQGAIVGALGPSGHIEGAIYLLISDYWYSDDWHLSELFSFVLPQYRKSNNAKELITFAKRCSDEIGIPLIIGVISNERTESKVRLYQKELAKPAGAFFVYDQHMPSSFPPRKIYEAEVRHMLEEKCKEVGGVGAWCRANKIGTSVVSLVLAKECPPTGQIASALGLKRELWYESKKSDSANGHDANGDRLRTA